MADQQFSRRSLLGSAFSAAIAAPLVGRSGLVSSGKGRRAKNVILMVSDGMNAAVAAMTDQYLQLVEGRRSVWYELAQSEGTVNGFMDTRSLDNFVTDSAAAASAWGSGRHVMGGAINSFPDGTFLTPLYRLLKEQGMKTGLVTTSSATHATPAGFAAYSTSRRAEEDIAVCYLTEKVDVVMGGGERFFDGDKRSDDRDVSGEFAKAGYTVVRSHADLKKASGKVLGLWSLGQVPYEIDRVNTPALKERVPSLRDMTREALRLLDGSREGFMLMVEGARVDHACHANDAAGTLFDQLAFEEALAEALAFARADGETLVVVTSDHGCGGPSLNFGPLDARERGLVTFGKSVASFEEVGPDLAGAKSAADLQDLILAKFGVRVTPEQAAFVIRDRDERILAQTGYTYSSAALAMVMNRHWFVGWTGTAHTGEPTLVSAIGPGSERFAGTTMNVDLFNVVLDVRGITFSNPKLTLAEARRMVAARDSLRTESVPGELVGSRVEW